MDQLLWAPIFLSTIVAAQFTLEVGLLDASLPCNGSQSRQLQKRFLEFAGVVSVDSCHTCQDKTW